MTKRQDEGAPQAVEDCHPLLAWIIPHLDRFPRGLLLAAFGMATLPAWCGTTAEVGPPPPLAPAHSANTAETTNPLPPGEGRVRAEVSKVSMSSAKAPSAQTLTPSPLPEGEGLRSAPCTDTDGLAPAMVVIAPGRFMMGSPDGEPGRSTNEGPRHEVTIPRPFALGACEVSVAQFARFVDETGYRTSAETAEQKGCNTWDDKAKDWSLQADRDWRDPGFPQAPDHPVACVSHRDALAYIHRLGNRTGALYRLPTEAEWEYAARAPAEGGADTAYYWGTDWKGQAPCDYANGFDRSAKRAFPEVSGDVLECDDGFAHTSPVGSKQPNRFGLHDLAGNVWEWTADCWHDSYPQAPPDGSVWQEETGGQCDRRVVRGGSWGDYPRGLRSAGRGRDTPGEADDLLGFRLARAL